MTVCDKTDTECKIEKTLVSVIATDGSTIVLKTRDDNKRFVDVFINGKQIKCARRVSLDWFVDSLPTISITYVPDNIRLLDNQR